MCIIVVCALTVLHLAANEAIAVSVQVDKNNVLSPASLATLEFVAVVTRHGSRTPLSTYPNDPYPYTNRLFWPVGPAELTAYGKNQLYETGEELRTRYSSFLPELYYPNVTTAEYNPYNRDFMSAACLLAALYPPAEGSVWKPSLLWQPIPLSVRTFDICDLTFDNTCPLYKAESDKLTVKLDQDGMRNDKTSELLRKISVFTGSNITKVSKASDLYDTLVMQEENGFKLPAWTKEFYPQPLKSLATPVLVTQFGGSDNLISMGAGPELKYINDMLNMKANGTYDKNRKIYIEAAHDCTLVALLKALGNNDPKLEIKTSAYLTFELHYLPEMYIVQVLYYKNSSDDNPQFINISGCPNPCSLDNFTRFVDRINPSNWNKKCHENT